jgi:hypothetical protein
MTHAITPPPELVQRWVDQLLPQGSMKAFTVAAQWGADQELEACCEWFRVDAVSEVIDVVSDLRAARRPKPPSLKEQALVVLDDVGAEIGGAHYNILLRALEALPDD